MEDTKQKEENAYRGTEGRHSKDANTRENNAQIEENIQQGGPKGPSTAEQGTKGVQEEGSRR